MPCPICKCETAMTVCPNCGVNANHANMLQSLGCRLPTPVEALALSESGHRLTATVLVKTQQRLKEALALLDCISNGTDCNVTGINGCEIDGILLTREYVARVNKFLKEVQ